MLTPIRTKYVFESNEFYRDINGYIMFAERFKSKLFRVEKLFPYIYYCNNNLTGLISYYYYYLLCCIMYYYYTIIYISLRTDLIMLE